MVDKLVTVSGFAEGRLVRFDNSQEVLFTEESSVLDSLESLLLTSSEMFLMIVGGWYERLLRANLQRACAWEEVKNIVVFFRNIS